MRTYRSEIPSTSLLLHFLIVFPLQRVRFFHSQIETRSEFSNDQRTVSIFEVIALFVEEANAEPFLVIRQMIRFLFKELE